MATTGEYKELYARWQRKLNNSGDPRLDALIDIEQHSSDSSQSLQSLRYSSLSLQSSPIIQDPSESIFFKIKNLTTSRITLDQIVDFDSTSTGVNTGSSLMSMVIYFNPDFTGSSGSVAQGKAYLNSVDGQFVNVTGIAIDVLSIVDFDKLINTDVLRLAGGQVSFFESNQNVASSAINKEITFERPIVIASNAEVVLALTNTALVDSGTESVTVINVAGRFISDGIPAIIPANLIAENDDNLISEGGDNLVSE